MIADLTWALTTAAILGGSPRWLRIAQREHYIAGSVTRFAVRWWLSRPANWALGGVLILSVGASWVGSWEATAVAGAISLMAPLGLKYKGRTSKLAWTRRLATMAVVAAVGVLAVAITGLLIGSAAGVVATTAACAPLLADLALLVTAPMERQRSAKFTQAATRRLMEVSPRVVGITGSFGKTSTKFYAGHLLRAKYMTMTSPASYNNMAGLSRAINERLIVGTEVFIAEMGTYGQGEIRALCRWLKPEIAVVTALGPVHLERMGSIDNIARAKAEILEGAPIGVINVDNPRLADIADSYSRQCGRLITCSTTAPAADVYAAVDGSKCAISVHAHRIVTIDLPGVFPGNVACAVGVALALDIPIPDIASRLETLPRPEHRQTVQRSTNGIIVIDDTYNSNPDGALNALATLASAGTGRRKVVVTPGMVELGNEQARANETFGRQAAAVGTDILIVGRTNRRALLRGALERGAQVTICTNRAEAVAWVRNNLGDGDAVLYENDLPDHYP
jgi:UDP-N-acetylmuramoyl-tripeptide--D-alanyl-D-alanine ligase